MRRHAPSLPLVLACAAGCTAPGLAQLTANDPPAEAAGSTTTGTTSLDPLPTTSAGGGPTSTSEDPGTTSVGGGTTGELPGTTEAPLAPPTIVGHELAPDPLQQPGPILISIATANADSISMQVDDEMAEILPLTEPNALHTDITFNSALDNGDHTATFIARRDALESAPLVIPFTVALPPGGTELFWHGDGALGQGVVVALAVTPAHELIELGTHYPQGQARCYLRRRDLGGAWNPLELVDVMPDTLCTAIDLQVDADGALHVLTERLVNGELRWWLGQIDSWGADPTHIGSGALGDTALVLALAPDRLAVCGTKQKQVDIDAAVWIFSPNEPGKILSFDYAPKLPHQFDESPNDCVFAGERLVLTGDAYGEHGDENVERERHFLLEVEPVTDQATWAVAGPGPGIRSKAQTIAADANGRYITGGYTCDDPCEPRGELRMFLPGGAQIWQKSLDVAVLSPRAIAWSPAGYLVFASARSQNQDTSFFAQAWLPLHGMPLWSYEHIDAPAIHAANALAIGPYGQIYAGGVTAGGYPAVAIIAP